MLERRSFKPIPLYPERRRLATRQRLGIAGALVVATATGGIGQYLNGDPLYVPGVIADFTTGSDCPNPGEENILRVQKTLGKITSEPESIGLEAYHTYVREQARKFGLTLVDINTHIGALNESGSISEALKVLNGLTSEFSMEIEIPKEKEIKDIYTSYRPVKDEELDLDKFKEGALYFMLDLQYMPVEIVQASGISKIKIVNSDEYPDPKNPSHKLRFFNGLYNEATTDMLLDLSGFYNRNSSFPHELAHGFDFEYCGVVSAINDHEYDARNPWNFEYGKNLDTGYQITADPYGSRGVLEDKAEALSLIFKAPEAYSVLGPYLQDKIDLLMTRLEIKVPNVSAYFAAIAQKSY